MPKTQSHTEMITQNKTLYVFKDVSRQKVSSNTARLVPRLNSIPINCDCWIWEGRFFKHEKGSLEGIEI